MSTETPRTVKVPLTSPELFMMLLPQIENDSVRDMFQNLIAMYTKVVTAVCKAVITNGGQYSVEKDELRNLILEDGKPQDALVVDIIDGVSFTFKYTDEVKLPAKAFDAAHGSPIYVRYDPENRRYVIGLHK